MTKTTETGTCQICGRTQKLPKGVLAKHGYNLHFGFFSGTCFGAGYQPLETGTDAIEKAIVGYAKQVEQLRATAELYRSAEAPDVRRQNAWAKGQPWVIATPEFATDEDGLVVSVKLFGQVSDAKRFRLNGKTVEAAKVRLNAAYAEYLVRCADATEHEIEVLRERIANWKPVA